MLALIANDTIWNQNLVLKTISIRKYIILVLIQFIFLKHSVVIAVVAGARPAVSRSRAASTITVKRLLATVLLYDN